MRTAELLPEGHLSAEPPGPADCWTAFSCRQEVLATVRDRQATREEVEALDRAGVVPSVLSVNAGIGACSRAGQWIRAMALLGGMRAWGGTPDRGGEQWQRALMLLDTLSTEECLAAAPAAAPGVEEKEEEAVTTEEEDSGEASAEEEASPWQGLGRASPADPPRCPSADGVPIFPIAVPDAGHGSAAAAAVAAAEQPAAEADSAPELATRLRPVVRRCVEELLFAGAPEAAPGAAAVYGAMASACSRAGRWELALQLLEEMPLHGLQPGAAMYSSVAQACGNGMQWARAHEVLGEMRALGIGTASCQGDTWLDGQPRQQW